MNVQCNLPYLSFFFSFLFVFHPPFFLPFCHPCPNSQSPVGIVHKKKKKVIILAIIKKIMISNPICHMLL